MSVIGSAKPDVVRIKVYRPNTNVNDDRDDGNTSSKKFCIDPRLTTYRTLMSLIAQAFDIKSDFTIHAVKKCPKSGQEQVAAIWSDWDLDALVQNIEPGSYLRLRYELSRREEGLDDWDFVGMNDFNPNIRWFNVDSRSIIATVNQTAGKAASALNKAINWMYGGNDRRSGKPIGENEMKRFLDYEGRLIEVNEFRQAVYAGGVESGYRKVVWRHLLNIFPPYITGLERIDYLKSVDLKYRTLRKRWMDCKNPSENTRLIMRAIEKDASRTDRAFGFYSDSGNGYFNTQSLFRILMTYCISHPNITYCQGMNDYASTILYVMREESLAYICFCAVMKRIRGNFATDGVAIATKLHHLKVILRAIDPVYWSFLESCDAVNLYFTYRWLLLECKREFPFNDALRVLEVMWATLPIENEPPALSETSLTSSPSAALIADISSSEPREKSLRRALSCPRLLLIGGTNLQNCRRRSSTFTYNDKEQSACTLEQQNQHQRKDAECGSVLDSDDHQTTSLDSTITNSRSTRTRSIEKGLENSFSISEISEFDLDNLSTQTTNNILAQFSSLTNWLQRLPVGDTTWLEDNNLFLHFLCVSILLDHREILLKQNNLDEQDISMHFDRYRRRHNAERILLYARTLYAQYIEWTRKKRMIEDLNRFSVS